MMDSLMAGWHRWLLVGTLCLLAHVVRAQQEPEQEEETSHVILLHSDMLSYDEMRHPGAQILTGNVRFRHDSLYMYCDSACYYEASNSFNAYGNVRMEQGDTLELVGDILLYDGKIQLAKMRENVVLTHHESQLFTDSLDYDRVYDLGYFFDGGVLVDQNNELSSVWGQYSPSTRKAMFNYNVILENPQFTLLSDTLNYNTQTAIANIVGPSTIDNGDNHIYSELGYYDTQKEQAILLERSVLTNKGKKMIGDSLWYDAKAGIGEAFRQIVYDDAVNKNMFLGNYCFHQETTGYTEATDSAVIIDYSQKDSLYMHADTFKVFTYNMNTDSMYREVHAYHKVRTYRVDVQAVCDSMVFYSQDSCLTMYRDPIVWNAGQQLLGEVIKIYMNDSTIDRVHVIDQTLSVERIDSVHYNQVAGKELISYFRHGEMAETHVKGNVYVDYYMFDDDSLMIGLNYTETTELKLFMKERKMDKIWMPAATGVIYPIILIPQDKLYLSNFAWFDYVRPLNKHDIFFWRPKASGMELKTSIKHKAPIQSLDEIKKRR